MRHQELRVLASKIRSSIEMAISESCYVDVELKHFPGGSCEIASVILGLYLKSIGYDEVVQCFGSRPKAEEFSTSQHVWLLVSGATTVDITADQFNDCTESVIVEDSSEFHKTFTIKETRPVTDYYLERPGSSGYSAFYEKVVNIANGT